MWSFPLITQPKAIKPSNFFTFFRIQIGISKTPGTLIMLKEILRFLQKVVEAFTRF